MKLIISESNVKGKTNKTNIKKIIKTIIHWNILYEEVYNYFLSPNNFC
jgi:hypothetical protein